jgi:hypothetical protein
MFVVFVVAVTFVMLRDIDVPPVAEKPFHSKAKF